MKKCVAMICGILLVLSLMACGGKTPETTAQVTTAAESTAPETTAPETTAAETTALETTAPETTAAETTVAALEPIHVRVAIAVAGEVVAAGESLEVTDLDKDGVYTVMDALQAAHNALYEGEDGFAVIDFGTGLGIGKLWGVENGGSYSTYVNDVAVMGMTDEVKDGDRVYAYSFQDLTSWSDMYTYFRASDEAENTYLLIGAGFDADWNPVDVPVAGAHILLDGEDSGIVTDEKGAFVLETLPKMMSAAVEEMIIVPPVMCFE